MCSMEELLSLSWFLLWAIPLAVIALTLIVPLAFIALTLIVRNTSRSQKRHKKKRQVSDENTADRCTEATEGIGPRKSGRQRRPSRKLRDE